MDPYSSSSPLLRLDHRPYLCPILRTTAIHLVSQNLSTDSAATCSTTPGLDLQQLVLGLGSPSFPRTSQSWTTTIAMTMRFLTPLTRPSPIADARGQPRVCTAEEAPCLTIRQREQPCSARSEHASRSRAMPTLHEARVYPICLQTPAI